MGGVGARACSRMFVMKFIGSLCQVQGGGKATPLPSSMETCWRGREFGIRVSGDSEWRR